MSAPSPAGQLQRRLGAWSAVAITVGAVIGSGIFLKPLPIAQALPSEAWIFSVWILLGGVCLCGALAYAELGAMLPEAGGQYAFLREGWGRLPAFLYGWCFFWVINSGTLAALAVAFADNLLPLLGVAPEQRENASVTLAAAMIVALAAVNHFGVQWGALLQNVSTLAKLGALGAIAAGGFLLAGAAAPETAAAGAASGADSASPSLATGLVVASVAIFWAYEGWYQLPFNAAELKRPERDLPRGLVLGILILVAVYLLVNAVYLRVLPLAEMKALGAGEAVEVPRRTVAAIFGAGASGGLSALIALSVLGAANPNLLSSPRAFYAMAQDGLCPHRLTRVHPRWGTPTWAIGTQAACALAQVVVLKTFDDLTAYVVFVSLVFYALTVAAVWRLRRSAPDRPRPFRCIGYPITPAIFVVVVGVVVVSVLAEETERRNALIGLGILAAGFPAYLLVRRAAPTR